MRPAKKSGNGKDVQKRAGNVRPPQTKDLATKGGQDGLISLALKNFQKHKKFKIQFAPDVTTIVGASDKGKSSLLRALGCVAVGEPDGQDLIRHDQPGYAIQLVVPNHTIVRKRGKKGNYYVLDGKRLVRDRSDWPPARVLDAVRLCPENFQWQLDGLLWFLDSAGTVAKQLNKVVDLEAIDAVLQAADRLAKEAVNKQEGAVQELEAAKHAYQSLKWVPQMCAAWETIEQKQAQLEKTGANKERLAKLLQKIQTAGKRKIPDSLFALWSAVRNKKSEIENTQVRRNRLASLTRRSEMLAGRIDVVARFRPAFDALSQMRAAAESAAARRGQLEHAIDQLEELTRGHERCLRNLEEAKDELAKVEKCPTCGQAVNLTGSRSSAPTYTSATKHRPHD